MTERPKPGWNGFSKGFNKVLEPRICVEDAPAKVDVDYLDGQMRRFNDAYLGPHENKPLAVFLRGQDQTILGGAYAFTSLEWLYIFNLWIQDDSRGKGYGSKLLVALETQAAARKCHSAIVDTYEFQALGFYLKRGYGVICELNDHPVPYKRYYLKKKLTPLGPVIQKGMTDNHTGS